MHSIGEVASVPGVVPEVRSPREPRQTPVRAQVVCTGLAFELPLDEPFKGKCLLIHVRLKPGEMPETVTGQVCNLQIGETLGAMGQHLLQVALHLLHVFGERPGRFAAGVVCPVIGCMEEEHLNLPAGVTRPVFDQRSGFVPHSSLQGHDLRQLLPADGRVDQFKARVEQAALGLEVRFQRPEIHRAIRVTEDESEDAPVLFVGIAYDIERPDRRGDLFARLAMPLGHLILAPGIEAGLVPAEVQSSFHKTIHAGGIEDLLRRGFWGTARGLLPPRRH